MSSCICKAIFLLLMPVYCFAQQGEAQKALERIGKIESGNRFLPSAVRMGVELGNFGYSFIDKRMNSFREFTADVDFHKYFLVVDYGHTSFSVNETYFDYSSEGSYFRIGPDINFIKDRSRNDVLFLGLRYGFGSFDETIQYSTSNEIQQQEYWPQTTVTENFQDIGFRWLEVNSGLRANVIDNFYMGFTLRIKFGLNVNSDKSFTSYYLPGYGKESFRPNFGGSYYIYYRLQFREKYKSVFKK